MREGYIVKGLTTAASVWAVACLGLAAGGGFYGLALVGMIFIFVTLTLFETIQHKFMHKNTSQQSYILETEDISGGLRQVFKTAEECHATVQNLEIEQEKSLFTIRFRAEYNGSQRHNYDRKFVEMLTEQDKLLRIRQSITL